MLLAPESDRGTGPQRARISLTSDNISISLDIWNQNKPFSHSPRSRNRPGSTCSGYW